MKQGRTPTPSGWGTAATILWMAGGIAGSILIRHGVHLPALGMVYLPALTVTLGRLLYLMWSEHG